MHVSALLKTLLLLCLIPCGMKLSSLEDLNDHTQSFVLEAKKIDIPGYPHAFNPSIIRYHDRLLLCFRVIPNPKFSFTSHLGLIWLDDDFNPIGQPHMLETADPESIIPSRAEDGRLITINDQLWLVYSDNKDSIISKGGFRVYIAQVAVNEGLFSLHNIERLSRFEGESQNRREKNWTPFEYQGQMLLAYSYTPHRILVPVIGTGECNTMCTTVNDIDWKWGELRGGTTGLKIDDDHYLSFFHSSVDMSSVQSNGKTTAHYFMGAYVYEAAPPFRITHISKEPIIGKGFYDDNIYKPYWKAVTVVFPGGFVQDDSHIWIVYGRHDHEAWMCKLEKQALLESLVPVSSDASNL